MTGSLGFTVKVGHDTRRAIAYLDSLPPLLNAAMRQGTQRGTKLLGARVEALVTSRTSMDAAVARAITKVEVLPSAGPISRGRVSFRPPPPRFYPKRKKALAFTIAGKKIVVRSVRGSRPYKLITEAADDRAGLTAIEEGYREEVEKVL